jgi:Zn-dependent M28 family amino/carboxypeptidase
MPLPCLALAAGASALAQVRMLCDKAASHKTTLRDVLFMKRLILAATAALTLAACDAVPGMGGGDALDIPEVANGELSEATMKDITRTLSSDEFEGRMPGTPGEEKTVAYLIEKFKAAGLQPGNGDSWVQDVPLVEITGKDFAPLTVSGAGNDGGVNLSFAPSKDWVGVSYKEQVQTSIEDAELVFVGYGIKADEKGWNDYAGIDMKGKIAVILVNDPDFGTEGLEGPFGGKAMTYYGRWTYKYEEAARQGAAGALIIHDTEPASYGWNVVESSWTGPQAFAQRGDNPPPLTDMNGWIQKSVGEQILKAAGQDLAKLSAEAKKEGFKAVPLGLTASTSFRNDIRAYNSQNVIGILPGSERPDEYVMHTAHWDHLGRCTPAPDGDDICNGAVDNATGTAALVALAEAQVKAGAPKRSLVFLAVTAEEQGLLGADYYAANPVFPLSQTVGGINMDAFLIAGPSKDVTVVGQGKSRLEEFLEAALEADGRTITPDPTPEAGYYYRSDHFAFAKRGVPMLYVDGGEDLKEGGRAAGEAAAKDYRDNRYHGPKDEYSEDWDWSGVMADLQLFYRIGRMLAESSSWPNWAEGDEFKAKRDEDCAAAQAGC